MEPGLVNCNDLTVLSRSRWSENDLLNATCFALQLQAFMSKIIEVLTGVQTLLIWIFCVSAMLGPAFRVGRWYLVWEERFDAHSGYMHVRMRCHHHGHVNPWCRSIEYWCRESAAGGTRCCGMWVYTTVYNHVGIFVKKNQLNHFGHLIRKNLDCHSWILKQRTCTLTVIQCNFSILDPNHAYRGWWWFQHWPCLGVYFGGPPQPSWVRETTFSHNWMKGKIQGIQGKQNSFLKFSPIFPHINTLNFLSPTHCIVLGKPWEVSLASRRSPIAKVTAMLESLEKKAGKCGVWQQYTVVPQNNIDPQSVCFGSLPQFKLWTSACGVWQYQYVNDVVLSPRMRFLFLILALEHKQGMLLWFGTGCRTASPMSLWR